MTRSRRRPVIVAGGGIGGLAAALALAQRGFRVKVLEQAAEIGEIGAGVQLAPNAFAAFDALGVGAQARGRAVYTERLVMMDAVDESIVAEVPTGEAFRARFGNPYAVIHRADVHLSLLEGVRAQPGVEVLHLDARSSASSPPTTAASSSSTPKAASHRGAGAGRLRRRQVGGARADGRRRRPRLGPRRLPRGRRRRRLPRRSALERRRGLGRAELPPRPLSAARRRPVQRRRHLPQPRAETWSVSEGSQAEVLSYFDGIAARPRRLLQLPKSWKRWATADRTPIAHWTHGRSTLLGDAAHPLLQYLAQGACMAIEDAVTLGRALAACDDDIDAAFALYQRSRVARTARVVLMTREMGRIYHAHGIERLVRNDLWRGRSAERFYDALEWLYGWTAERCLAS